MSKDQSNQNYDPAVIEPKWLRIWEEKAYFYQPPPLKRAADQTAKKEKQAKVYNLFAFAYPSGSGLHVGHVESKTALDILTRFQRMHGKKVLFPVGWDAFGLPAENYAIKTGIPPAETTKKAINTFRRQIKRLAISYNWDNEIATSHPGYYRWTQWLFLELYRQGLAYKKKGSVNWCPSCQTVLANEQVVDGHCERCDTAVVQKELEQWYFKITQYRDELISGLDQVDWPRATKRQQLNWIGKKVGIKITYPVVDEQGRDRGEVVCFTTRPDTNFGATFVVLAPEHPLAEKVAQSRFVVADYIQQAHHKTELERQQEGRKKSGAFTGLYAINQLTGYKMPIWVADFVLGHFGTGAVVGVPGHDRRDFEFAQFVNQNYPSQAIEIIRVVVGPDGDRGPIDSLDKVQEKSGKMIQSDFLNGLEISRAIDKMMDYLEKKGWGKRTTSYKLRDWLISRQRYWGTPIPIVYDPKGRPHPVKDEHLPWLLPTDVDFKPTGESPLKSSREFIERTEKLYGKGWRPEFDTMDTFVDSSWYYLRYVSARDEQQFAAPDLLRQWLPVDFYMIGPEHIVLHLLYSRFFTKFLHDQGYLHFSEPFLKMRHQGMILGPDGKKMSKSKGNVINPDEIVAKFGADTLRLYEMFMGPIESDKPWDVRAVMGVYKFLSRVWHLVLTSNQGNWSESLTEKARLSLRRKLHLTIKKVSEDIPKLKFNTAIASLMELVKLWEDVVGKASVTALKNTNLPKKQIKSVLSLEDLYSFVRLLAPFTPFLAEELFDRLKKMGLAAESASIHFALWPQFDQKLIATAAVNVVIQVNGKRRAQLSIANDRINQREWIIEQAQQLPKVAPWLDHKTVRRVIYVPARIVNFVVA